MTKEKYMALADLQTVWTNTLKPWIAAGFIAVTAVAQGETAQLVLQDGSLLPQSTFQAAGSYVTTSQMGAASGVATLDANGFVPSSQLPSYVDDVIEAANFAALPAEGEGGKIYVTLDDNKTYRWGGSAYAEISASIALGETTGTAYEGSKGAALKSAYDTHAADADIHVTAALQTAWNAKYDKPSGGIPKTDMAQSVQDSLALADSALQSHQDISGKADKDADAVENNFAKFDANGNPVDSGYSASSFQAAGNYKTQQTAVTDPTAAGNAVEFIATISQDTNGVINPTKSTIPTVTASSGGTGGNAGLMTAAQAELLAGIEVPERVTAQELAAFTV